MTHNLRHIFARALAALPAVLAATLALAAALMSGRAHAQQKWVAGTPYQIAETGQRFNRMQDAIFAIGKGRGTILIDDGRWEDCGVQVEGEVTFQARHPGKVFFYGPNVCEAKAIFVLRGVSSRVIGFNFFDIHNASGNGAGIRLEKGNLYAAQNWFANSDEGILGDNDPASTVTIDKSTFSGLGRCGGYAPCAHSIYINYYAALTVTRCRFEAGRGGHYLKSRAARIEAIGNSFDDSKGTATNYTIDLPAGATGRITGNWIVQGAHKENPSALITIAAEEKKHPSSGLLIVNNVVRMAPGALPTAFVADWQGDAIVIGQNLLDADITRYQRR